MYGREGDVKRICCGLGGKGGLTKEMHAEGNDFRGELEQREVAESLEPLGCRADVARAGLIQDELRDVQVERLAARLAPDRGWAWPSSS